MTVRAKFVTENIEDAGEGLKTISLRAVYGGVEGNENTEYWRYTPSGYIQLSTVNEGAAAQFIIGQEVYVDFTPAMPLHVEIVAPPPSPAKQIAALVKQLRGDQGRPASRELSLAVTKLEEAGFWLAAHKDQP